MTLSPILVVPAYLAVFVFEHDELLSWLLKHYLKEERPYGSSLRLLPAP